MLLIILYYIVVCRINKSKRNQRLARKLKDKTRKKIEIDLELEKNERTKRGKKKI